MTAAASTLPKLDPLDPLGLDAQLDDEERLIRDTVRQYVRERFLPHVAEHFEAGTFPEHVAEDLGRLGLLGMHLHGYGCAGASAPPDGLTRLELEAGGPRAGAVFLGAGAPGPVPHPPRGSGGAE